MAHVRIALLAILLASPAMAQGVPQAPPDPDQVIAQCNVAIGTAQVNQGQAELQVVALRKQLADAQKQIAAKKVAPGKITKAAKPAK